MEGIPQPIKGMKTTKTPNTNMRLLVREHACKNASSIPSYNDDITRLTQTHVRIYDQDLDALKTQNPAYAYSLDVLSCP